MLSKAIFILIGILISMYAMANESKIIIDKSLEVDKLLSELEQESLAQKVKPKLLTQQLDNKVQITSDNLNKIDNTANDLVSLKRKLEIEKAKAELNKIHNGGSNNTVIPVATDNIQTTVTGVAINQDGKKIAWLQFADGGTLAVNLGSAVGDYVVSDINMSGVKLRPQKGGGQSVVLKRAYTTTEKSKNSVGVNRLGFTPSPIITDANNDMVPPIVPIR